MASRQISSSRAACHTRPHCPARRTVQELHLLGPTCLCCGVSYLFSLPKGPSLTATSRGKECGDPATRCPDALGQGALRTQFHRDLACEVLSFQLLVCPQVRHDHAIDLAVFCQERQSSPTFRPCIIRHSSERVKRFWSSPTKRCDERGFFAS